MYGRRRKRPQAAVQFLDSDEDSGTSLFSAEKTLLGGPMLVYQVTQLPGLLSSPNFKKLLQKQLPAAAVELAANDALTTSPKRLTRLLETLGERELPPSPTRKKRAVSSTPDQTFETPGNPQGEASEAKKLLPKSLPQKTACGDFLTGLSASPRAKTTPKETSAWLDLLDDLEPTETPTIAFTESFEPVENESSVISVDLTEICRSLETYLEQKPEQAPPSKENAALKDTPRSEDLYRGVFSPNGLRSYSGDRSFLLERDTGASEDQDHRIAHNAMISALHDFNSSSKEVADTTDLRMLGRLHALKDELNYITAGIKFGPPAAMATALADIYVEIGTNSIFRRPGAVRHVLLRLAKVYSRVQVLVNGAEKLICSGQNDNSAAAHTETQKLNYLCVLRLAGTAIGRLLDVHVKTLNAETCSELLSDNRVCELIQKLEHVLWGTDMPSGLLKQAYCSIKTVLDTALHLEPAHVQLLLVRVVNGTQNPSFCTWETVRLAVEACKRAPEGARPALTILEAYLARGLPLRDEGWCSDMSHVLSRHVTDPSMARIRALLCAP